MKSKYLEIRELVPPEIHTARGDRAWELIDPGLISLLDRIWEKCGEFTVNDWHKGGQYKESGLRSAGTATGAALSMHKFGKGADLKSKKFANKDFYEKVKFGNFGDFTIENIDATPTWTHVDVRNNQIAGVRIINV